MKRITGVVLVCVFFLLSLSGCGTNKLSPFGKTPEEMAVELNESLDAVGTELNITEFTPQENDDGTMEYRCELTDAVSISFLQISTDSSYRIFVDISVPVESTVSEHLDDIDDFIDVCNTMVLTLDPRIDHEALFDRIDLYSMERGSYAAKSMNWQYSSYTTVTFKSFSVGGL